MPETAILKPANGFPGLQGHIFCLGAAHSLVSEGAVREEEAAGGGEGWRALIPSILLTVLTLTAILAARQPPWIGQVAAERAHSVGGAEGGALVTRLITPMRPHRCPNQPG